MDKKESFIELVKKLMEAAPEVMEEYGSQDALAYWEGLQIMNDSSQNKKEITCNGKIILEFLQSKSTSQVNWRAKDIAEELFISSRTVSGAMRKLVTDGYVEKLGQNPVIYSITDKGLNFNLNEEGEKVNG